jgi:2'-5' RNA ligase
MLPAISTIPGYRIYEYLLVLKPHDELYNRIKSIKREFADVYKAPIAAFIKPHITLVSFLSWSMMEEKIIRRLQLISMGVTPFKVELNNFGSFPSHTIYINVITKEPVKALVKELKATQRLMKCTKEDAPHFIDAPNLTICRGLKPWQYKKGWPEYAHRHFSGRFIADCMLLLKRPVGEKSFQIAKRFEFMNLPVATRQGSLFGPLSPEGGT